MRAAVTETVKQEFLGVQQSGGAVLGSRSGSGSESGGFGRRGE